MPTATDLPLLSPSLSTLCWCKTVHFSNLRKKLIPPSKKIPIFWKVLWSQANISNTFFNQKSPRHPQVVVLRWHGQTHRQTDRNGNSITYPSQRPESVKSENSIIIYEPVMAEMKRLFGLIGETWNFSAPILAFFRRVGGSYSKDDREPFSALAWTFLKKNGQGWQKLNTFRNFSPYKIGLK